MLLPPAITLPFEYGIGLSEENQGIMDNHGIELTIGSKHQFQKRAKIGIERKFQLRQKQNDKGIRRLQLHMTI